MFIIEDPGQPKSERERYFRRSKINSHLATRLHARRRAGKSGTNHVVLQTRWQHALTAQNNAANLRFPPKRPNCHFSDTPIGNRSSTGRDGPDNSDDQVAARTDKESLLPGLVWADNGRSQEKRSMRYFKEKTAYEWSGYTDYKFWDHLILQASYCEPAIKHAAVALGAFHELANVQRGLPYRDQQQNFAIKQSNIALNRLNADHASMSACSLLSAYVIISAMMLCYSDMSFTRVQQLQFDLFDHIMDNPSLVSPAQLSYITEYLEPLVSRQRSKAGYYIDMSWGLRVTPAWCFETADGVKIPESFTSIGHAREVLETLLNWTAYTTKVKQPEPGELPYQAPIYLDLFLFALAEYMKTSTLSKREILRLKLIRISAKLNFMLIRLMHVSSDDLMMFDQFLPDFTEMADVFEEIQNFTEKDTCQGLSFGIDSGLLGFVGNCSRWCREPTVRRRLISLLWRSGRREGMEGAVAYAAAAEQAMQLEEAGIDPPPSSCHDIPQTKRVKILDSRFWIMKLMIIRYQTFPYGPNDFTDIHLPHHGCGSILNTDDFNECIQTESPGVIIGVGYLSTLDFSTGKRHFTIRDPRFYFPVPRI